VVSNAFSISKNTAAIYILLLKLRVTWSVSLIICSVVLWRARKQNWLALSSLLSSMYFWTILRMSFSNNLPVVERRLIGCQFWGNFGSLPGFGNVMTFAALLPSVATCSRWFLARRFFYPEDGGDTFLRNVSSYKNYRAPHYRKWLLHSHRHENLKSYIRISLCPKL
jgi:hypothetical protein